MNTVKIITERLSSLSYEFAKRENITLFPANIIMKDHTFKDNNDSEATEFLKQLENVKEIPSTAVPSQGEMISAFNNATTDTKEGIYIAASKRLSSIHDQGKTAAETLKKEGKNIQVFDTEGVVSIEGMFAYKANLLSQEGKSIDEILNQLAQIRKERRIIEYGVIETLKFLEKNGRIGKAKSWIAQLFSFKPVITAKDGELGPITRVRTNFQGLDVIIKLLKEDVKRTNAKQISVMYDYGLSDDFLRGEVNKRVQSEFPHAHIISFNQISTVIACHLGPKIWGVCFLLE